MNYPSCDYHVFNIVDPAFWLAENMIYLNTKNGRQVNVLFRWYKFDGLTADSDLFEAKSKLLIRDLTMPSSRKRPGTLTLKWVILNLQSNKYSEFFRVFVQATVLLYLRTH